MCGIAGILGVLPPDGVSEVLQRALWHRGPDDGGHWQEFQGVPVTLVHRRLAIQDLTVAGQQPMVSACDRYVLVFNGEIYNQRQLRRQLEERGHRFHSSSDTEVLLALLVHDGSAALQQLRGMYAFCLWDRHDQRALLARDPFGIKPLYLWQGPRGELLFASELRSLLATGLVPRRVDSFALSAFLSEGSVPEPRSLVADVTSLPAGWYGQWQAGVWSAQAHWHPDYRSGSPKASQPAIQLTRQALDESLQSHLLSDVPVGLFLSGGIDSASLLSLAGSALTSLTIGFEEKHFDESARAACLARHFGSQHVALSLSAERCMALVSPFLAAVDQPSVDGFNTYCVARLASEQGLKVALSGLGGDELFGGYPSFGSIPRLLRWHRQLGLLRRSVSAQLSRRRGHRCQRLAAFLDGPATVSRAHRCVRGLFSPVEIKRLLCHWGLDAEIPSPMHERLAPRFASADASAVPVPDSRFPTIKDQIAWLESTRYMGSQLLRDSDTYSMAHGLELRLPLVDVQLMSTLVTIPAAQRLASGKQLLQRAVPEIENVAGRALKQGFSFPLQVWLDPANSSIPSRFALPPLPSTPADIDLSPWARRWGLMVLYHWLSCHLDIDLPAVPFHSS
ncbi:MAG: asparagine synthase (glutamine-hydrolyzing) [Cyanobium sp.]